MPPRPAHPARPPRAHAQMEHQRASLRLRAVVVAAATAVVVTRLPGEGLPSLASSRAA